MEAATVSERLALKEKIIGDGIALAAEMLEEKMMGQRLALKAKIVGEGLAFAAETVFEG